MINNSAMSNRFLAIKEISLADLGEHYKHIFGVEFKKDEVKIVHNLEAKFAAAIGINIIHNSLLSFKNSSVKTFISLKYLQKVKKRIYF